MQFLVLPVAQTEKNRINFSKFQRLCIVKMRRVKSSQNTAVKSGFQPAVHRRGTLLMLMLLLPLMLILASTATASSLSPEQFLPWTHSPFLLPGLHLNWRHLQASQPCDCEAAIKYSREKKKKMSSWSNSLIIQLWLHSPRALLAWSVVQRIY